MTAPLSAQRVEELRRDVYHCEDDHLDKRDITDLLAILSDYSSLRAENERLKKPIGFHDVDEFYPEEKEPTLGDWKSRAEKAKAENDEWGKVLEDAANKHLRNLDKIARLEAQLAKQTPLIQAVMEAKLFPAPTDGRTCIDSHEKIIREALKLREKKGETK